MKQEVSPTDLQATEIQIYQYLRNVIPNKHMIDVGAHLGSSFLPFLQAGWKIEAFEPVQENRVQLQQSYGNHPDVRIHPEAVSDSSGVKDLHLALNSDGALHSFYHSFEELPANEYQIRGKSIPVRTVSLNDMAAGGGVPCQVGFLKIDTEGHDLAVLRGASQIQADVISAEFWGPEHALGRSPSPLPAMVSLLKGRGYLEFIVLAHSGSRTYYRCCDVTVNAKDWGNILFFSDKHSSIYQDCVKHFVSHEAPWDYKLPPVLRQLFKKPVRFVDVGAYHGNFTAGVMTSLPGSKGLLIEPVPASFEFLRARFQDCSEITTISVALSSQAGQREILISENAPTSSLLKSSHSQSTVSRVEVKTETLDAVLPNWSGFERVDLIKVDTQGHDLNVLQGALKTIREHTPVLLLECIFVPLYEGQDSYFEVMEFMNRNDYRLAGIVNAHNTQRELLGFADLLFLPIKLFNQLVPALAENHSFNSVDGEQLIEENAFLLKTCEERLELIHQLTRAAEERLRIIEILDAKIKRFRW